MTRQLWGEEHPGVAIYKSQQPDIFLPFPMSV
ncbi:hypothetical protein NOS3756_45690 [Nostoc sp. NIES-3756]|nr:hypothetical protein NOS3756_45690 [Nostoc sp. NIES-3756]